MERPSRQLVASQKNSWAEPRYTSRWCSHARPTQPPGGASGVRFVVVAPCSRGTATRRCSTAGCSWLPRSASMQRPSAMRLEEPGESRGAGGDAPPAPSASSPATPRCACGASPSPLAASPAPPRVPPPRGPPPSSLPPGHRRRPPREPRTETHPPCLRPPAACPCRSGCAYGRGPPPSCRSPPPRKSTNVRDGSPFSAPKVPTALV